MENLEEIIKVILPVGAGIVTSIALIYASVKLATHIKASSEYLNAHLDYLRLDDCQKLELGKPSYSEYVTYARNCFEALHSFGLDHPKTIEAYKNNPTNKFHENLQKRKEPESQTFKQILNIVKY